MSMRWFHLKSCIVVTLVLSFCSAAGVFRDPWMFRANHTSTSLMHEFDDSDQPIRASISSSWTSWRSDIGQKYDFCLDTAPLFTKSVTAAIISALGDMLAQCLDAQTSGHQSPLLFLDWIRVAGVITEGLFISGPLMHTVYAAMERRWPTADSYWAPFAHVMVDELFLDAMSVFTFFVFTGIFTGKTGRQICRNVKTEFLYAFMGGKATSLLLLPLMLYQFKYVPEKYRVLIVNLGDIGWCTVTSYFCNRRSKEKQIG